VLSKDGYFFIFEHNPFNPLTLKIVNDCPFDKDACLVSAVASSRLLRKAGFVSKFRFIIFFPNFIRNKELLEKFLWWLPLGGQYYTVSKKEICT
jgi:hypothetical protein